MAFPSKLHTFYWSLDKTDRERYAKRAGTRAEYLRLRLIPKYSPPISVPRPVLMRKLASQSTGGVTYPDVLEHFYDHNRRGKTVWKK